MIRTSVFRNFLLKSALTKDVSATKLVRCFTVVCKPNRRKLTFRNEGLEVARIELFKNSPIHRFYGDYPDHVKVTLPALSPTTESGTIVSWEKKEGDKLNEGDLLAEIETDKATMGYETPMEGYLAKIIVPAGTKNVPIGQLICIIVEEEGNVSAFKDFVDTEAGKPKESAAPAPTTHEPAAPLATSPPVSQAPLVPPPVSSPPSKSGDRIYASPMARRLAAEKGISLEAVGKGTGIYGSITSQDLSRAQAGAKLATSELRSGDSFADVSVTNLRSSVAKRFLASKQNVPHYYLSVDINIDKILSLQNKFNAFLEKENVKLSVNDFVVKAVALSCKKVPEANSAWQETFIRQYNTVNVSLAIHTDNGLLTPVIFDADIKGLATINSETKFLSAKAREGKLQPSECEGGTVSVTNLSSYGVKNFSAIINPPQVCVLSIGATEQKLIEDKNSPCGFKVSEMLPVTLSCDHRVLDGAVGAQWLAAFRQFLEHPDTMML